MNREELTKRAEAAIKSRTRGDQRPTPAMLHYLESLMEDRDLGIPYLREETGRKIQSVSDLHHCEVWKIISDLKRS